jgi:hypothetical protein
MCQTRQPAQAGKPTHLTALSSQSRKRALLANNKGQVLPPPIQARIAQVGANRREHYSGKRSTIITWQGAGAREQPIRKKACANQGSEVASSAEA